MQLYCFLAPWCWLTGHSYTPVDDGFFRLFFFFFNCTRHITQSFHFNHLLGIQLIGIDYIQNAVYTTIYTPSLFNDPSVSSAPPPSLPQVPGRHHSTFCLYEFASSRCVLNGIIECLSVCDVWLTSPSRMLSGFIRFVACARMSFLFEAE